MKTAAWGTLTLLAIAAPLQAQAPALWGALSAGPYGVGYQVFATEDSARSAQGSRGPRPVQVVVWYPASGGLARRARFRDYYLLTNEQTLRRAPTADEASGAIDRFIAFLGNNGVGAAAALAWLNSDVAGMRDAAPAAGSFPLVILAQGNFHSPYNQAVLAEYLASHGYVVATTPSQSLVDGPPPEGASVLVQVRAQAADLAQAIRTVRALPNVDGRRVVAIGHSFGARAALLLSLEQPLAALVSLDGGIANRLGREWLDGVPFDRARWRTPLLHIFQEGDPIVQPDFTLIRSLHAARRTLVRVDSLPHAGFATLGFVAGTISGFQIGTAGSDLAGRASAVAAVTLNFLDAVVKRRDVALLNVVGRQYLHLVDPDRGR